MPTTEPRSTPAAAGAAPRADARQLARAHGRPLVLFVLVGALSALTHLAVVRQLVEGYGWPPLAANVGGFAVSFCVSFVGHSHGTFGGRQVGLLQRFKRFGSLALAGFVLNQFLYASLLALLPREWYLAVLAFVLLTIAAVTYWASHRWAFAE
jgi:putative flippase GtrA